MKHIIICISIALGLFLANTTIAQNRIPNWEFVNEVDYQNLLVEFSTDDGNMYGIAGTGMLKYDSKGKQIWSRKIISYPANVWAQKITTDNHFITLHFSQSETITIGSTIINNPDKKPIVILSKIDSSANIVWTKNFEFFPSNPSNLGFNSNVSISIDADENIYMSSSFGGKLIIDGVEIEAETKEWWLYRPDIFMAKFSPTGELYWLKNLGTSNDGVAVTDNIVSNDGKSLYITGGFRGDTLRFSPDTLFNNKVGPVLFFMQLDTSGETNWIKSLGQISSQSRSKQKLKMDKKNNVVVCYTAGSPRKTTTVQKFNNAGENFLFATFNNDDRDDFFGLEIDDNGDIYLGLNFESYILKIPTRKHKFGTITPTMELENPGFSKSDICLLKYDSAFNLIWYKHIINKGEDRVRSLIKDKNNSIYITGVTANTFNGSDSSWFGNHTFYFNNSSDQYFFLAKINSCVYPPLNLIKNNTVLEAPDTWDTWEWYLDGERIENANWYSYAPKKSGTYIAGTRETNGCLRLTEPYTWIMTGVDDISYHKENISIYPNPANKSFALKTPKLVDNISIYNTGGQLVKSIPTNQHGEYQIDIQNSGLYFIKVASSNGFLMEKVVIW